VAPLSFLLYRALGALALGPALALPVVRGRFGTRWPDRLGYTLTGGGNPLWLHGASVGEAGSALAILQSLRDLGFTGPALLTSGTPAGLAALTARLKACPALGRAQIAAPPLDFLGAPGRFLDRVAPRALIVIETEIWPELFLQSSLRSTPVLMLSARLSQRSHDRLTKFRGFIAQTLAIPALVATIGETDLRLLTDLGLDPQKAAAIGSPKFDALIAQAQATLDRGGPGQSPPGGPPLILAGSTHPGEEELILRAVGSLPAPGPALAMAPRHLTRIPDIVRLIESMGHRPSLFSATGALRPPQGAPPNTVTLVDKMGLLASLYRECDLALVGGSFVPGSGHNPLEPAAAGKPIIFGPNMSSFKDEAAELEALGAAVSAPKAFLPQAISAFLSNPAKAQASGLSGLRYLSEKKPVAPILARLALKFLSGPAPDGPQKALAYLRGQAQARP
jgi:3-deoxy-D-manno-octulosonic-acid transferase